MARFDSTKPYDPIQLVAWNTGPTNYEIDTANDVIYATWGNQIYKADLSQLNQ